MSQIYFGTELYRFRADLLSIIRSLNIVYTATGICQASYVDCLLARSGSILTSLVLVILYWVAFVFWLKLFFIGWPSSFGSNYSLLCGLRLLAQTILYCVAFVFWLKLSITKLDWLLFCFLLLSGL